MTRFNLIAITILLVVLSGCSQQAQLVAYNRTETELTIVDPDGKSHLLKPGGRMETIFFGAGSRFYVTRAGVRFGYTTPKYPPREYRGEKYPYEIVVTFNEDMAIYVCYPDGREVVDQPDGFPVKPIE